MTDAELEAEKNRVRAMFDRWRTVLGLDEWHITLNYRDAEYVKQDGEPSGKWVLGFTQVDWEYRRAVIDFRCDLTAGEPDADLEYCVVHEAMHILLNGQRAVRELGSGGAVYREYERLFEEHTATTMARAFIRARAAGA